LKKIEQAKNLSELIQEKLNLLKGVDVDGNDKRFKWQFWTWIVGGVTESSQNLTVRNVGTQLRVGAENSFADYAAEIVAKKIRDYLRNIKF